MAGCGRTLCPQRKASYWKPFGFIGFSEDSILSAANYLPDYASLGPGYDDYQNCGGRSVPTRDQNTVSRTRVLENIVIIHHRWTKGTFQNTAEGEGRALLVEV